MVASWEVDLTTCEITGSPELNRLSGFPPEASPTLEDFRSRYAPGERERLQRERDEVTARGENKDKDGVSPSLPDGTEKWLLLRAQINPGQRIIGVVMDVTERKRAPATIEPASGR